MDYNHQQTELILYSVNDEYIWKQLDTLYKKHTKKLNEGKFIEATMVRQVEYILHYSAKKYCKELGGGIRTHFPKTKVRIPAAKSLVIDFLSSINKMQKHN